MLRVIGFTEISKASLELDGFVPMSFQCAEARSDVGNLAYWRAGNFGTSLIEIGVNQKTGAIFDVTLVATGNVLDLGPLGEGELPSSVTRVHGLPVCGVIVPNESSQVDDELDLLIGHTLQSVIIWFGERVELSAIYEVDRLKFGVDHLEQLCMIQADNLTETELKNFLRTVPTPET